MYLFFYLPEDGIQVRITIYLFSYVQWYLNPNSEHNVDSKMQFPLTYYFYPHIGLDVTFSQYIMFSEILLNQKFAPVVG